MVKQKSGTDHDGRTPKRNRNRFFIFVFGERMQEEKKQKTQRGYIDGEPVTPEMILSRIDEGIAQFYDDHGTPGKSQEEYYINLNQNTWYAALMFARQKAIPDYNTLKIDGAGIWWSSQGIYDYILLYAICEKYVTYCSFYDKDCSIMGFSYLTGIDIDVIHSFNDRNSNININNNIVSMPLYYKQYLLDNNISMDRVQYITILNQKRNSIYKRIRDARQESLSAKLATGNKNPVGVLAILNRHYAWNMPGVRTDTAQIERQDAAALPDFSKNIVQIAQENNDVETDENGENG